jgi:hypothetical protein
LNERLREPEIQRWLAKVNFHTDAEFFACFLADRPFLAAVAQSAPLHTDDNILLEFAAPRSLYSPRRNGTMRLIPVPEEIIDFGNLSEREREGFIDTLDLAVSAREHQRLTEQNVGPFSDHVKAALALSPRLPWANEHKDAAESPRTNAGILDNMRQNAADCLKQGDVLGAADLLCQRAAQDPLNQQARKEAAQVLLAAAKSMKSSAPEASVHLLSVVRRMGREIVAFGGSQEVLTEALKEMAPGSKK